MNLFTGIFLGYGPDFKNFLFCLKSSDHLFWKATTNECFWIKTPCSHKILSYSRRSYAWLILMIHELFVSGKTINLLNYLRMLIYGFIQKASANDVHIRELLAKSICMQNCMQELIKHIWIIIIKITIMIIITIIITIITLFNVGCTRYTIWLNT